MSDNNPVILLVDDEDYILRAIRRAMPNNANIYEARSGFEALIILGKLEKVDLIITDIKMDGMDGFQLIYEVKKNKNHSDVPFLFVTGLTDIDDKIKGLKLRAIE